MGETVITVAAWLVAVPLLALGYIMWFCAFGVILGSGVAVYNENSRVEGVFILIFTVPLWIGNGLFWTWLWFGRYFGWG